MKFSIITVCYNSSATIRDTIESVLTQTYKNIEYIIVDGKSSDDTIEIIENYEHSFNGRLKWISEPDNGIYHAMNKGISMSTGEIIGILNSDDLYTSNEIIEKVSLAFEKGTKDIAFGDLHYFSTKHPTKSVRKYSGKYFKPWLFRWGYMPPHPTLFVKKHIYEQFGVYNESFDISGDYELMIRLMLVKKLPYMYIHLDMVGMRIGGKSTQSVRSILVDNNRNILHACKSNGIYTNIFMISFRYFYKFVSLLT